MHIRKIFPRGFEVREIDPIKQYPEVMEVSGNKEVSTLYKNWILVQKQPPVFESVETATRLAHTLIGQSLKEWYVVNASNEFLNLNALSFMEDTINFLVTGKRRLSMENWHLLLSNKERRDGPAGPVKTYAALTTLNGESFFKDAEYISAWLSKPNGITDLIQSLQILFGEHQDRAVPNRFPYNPAIHKAIYGLNP